MHLAQQINSSIWQAPHREEDTAFCRIGCSDSRQQRNCSCWDL